MDKNEVSTKARGQVPIREGMMRPPSDTDPGCLLGSRCNDCGELFFIERRVCERCQSQNLSGTALSRHGTLYAFSVMHYPAPPPYQPPDPFEPYGAGWIELPEGLILYGLLTENDPEKLHTGMPMELVIDAFSENEDGQQIMTYRFKPASTE